jgi:hypothetical protein
VTPIRFETGLYENIKLEERCCFNCSNLIEDETHVILHYTINQSINHFQLPYDRGNNTPHNNGHVIVKDYQFQLITAIFLKVALNTINKFLCNYLSIVMRRIVAAILW